MRTILWTLFVGICLVASTAQSRAAVSLCNSIPGNLVLNCGFELQPWGTANEFDKWTLSGTDVPDEQDNLYGVETDDPFNGPPNSGEQQAYFGDILANPITISQTIATQAGGEYFVSFYLAQTGTPDPAGCTGDCANSVSSSFAGATLLDASNIGEQGYELYKYEVVATSASSTLSFTFGNDYFNGYFLLDDVSVVTPEPSAWTLMLVVAGGCVFLLRRKASHGVAK
jgi:hypothetical protein